MPEWSVLDEVCRECRDLLPYGEKIPLADFVLWGKFFPQEAFGPRCSGHADKYFPIHQADQYAVIDLRRARQEQLDLKKDRQLVADHLAEGKQTLEFVADRMDEFAYDELSSVLSEQVYDDETGRSVGVPSIRVPTPNVPFGPEGVRQHRHSGIPRRSCFQNQERVCERRRIERNRHSRQALGRHRERASEM